MSNLKVSKTELILRDLIDGRVMTHHKALAYGTYRLADVVYRLRAKGYRIDDRTATARDGTRYTEYFIPRDGMPVRFTA